MSMTRKGLNGPLTGAMDFYFLSPDIKEANQPDND
jgi:hypothetical protein